eukprot:gene12322-biopygen10981
MWGHAGIQTSRHSRGSVPRKHCCLLAAAVAAPATSRANTEGVGIRMRPRNPSFSEFLRTLRQEAGPSHAAASGEVLEFGAAGAANEKDCEEDMAPRAPHSQIVQIRCRRHRPTLPGGRSLWPTEQCRRTPPPPQEEWRGMALFHFTKWRCVAVRQGVYLDRVTPLYVVLLVAASASHRERAQPVTKRRRR